MKKKLKNVFYILLFVALGIISSGNVKSEELSFEEERFCSTAWIPQIGSVVLRCGLCDILLNKKGSWAGSVCPPT